MSCALIVETFSYEETVQVNEPENHLPVMPSLVSEPISTETSHRPSLGYVRVSGNMVRPVSW